jgi:hypothetical protein
MFRARARKTDKIKDRALNIDKKKEKITKIKLCCAGNSLVPQFYTFAHSLTQLVDYNSKVCTYMSNALPAKFKMIHMCANQTYHNY